MLKDYKDKVALICLSAVPTWKERSPRGKWQLRSAPSSACTLLLPDSWRWVFLIWGAVKLVARESTRTSTGFRAADLAFLLLCTSLLSQVGEVGKNTSLDQAPDIETDMPHTAHSKLIEIPS